ncbi:hypothetical protein JCM3774_006459 [Rhodotorula dairenensis]
MGPRGGAADSPTSGRTTSPFSLLERPSQRQQQQQRSPLVSTLTLRTPLAPRTRLTLAPQRHDGGRDDFTSSNSTPATTPSSTISTRVTFTKQSPPIGAGRRPRMSDESIHSSSTLGTHRGDQHTHRPLLPHFCRSDETPAGRIKYRRTGSAALPATPCSSRRGNRHLVEHEEDANEADDEHIGLASRPKKRETDDEVASPGRAHRFKCLIRKGSKFNLRAAAGGEVISSPSQDLYVPPIAELDPVPNTPQREMPSYFPPLALSTSRTSATSTPSAAPGPELRPTAMSRSGSFGIAVSASAELSRVGKAARVLGEEVKASGKAARVLGIEANRPPGPKSLSTPTRRPSHPSPPNSVRSLQITSPTVRPAPASPTPRRHRRKRSLSGPSAFASLEIPMTTPEISSSSDEEISATRQPRTLAAESVQASPSTAAVPTLGLVTPPPSPPSVPPLLASTITTEDELALHAAATARGRDRSKIASVASSTYALSVYQDRDDAPERNRHRLSIDSIRFSSAFEGVTGLSTSSGNGSQSRNSLAVSTTNGSGPAFRDSVRLGRPLPLGSWSRSTSTMPVLRVDSSAVQPRPSSRGRQRRASADWSASNLLPGPVASLPPRPRSVSPGIEQEGAGLSELRPPQLRRPEAHRSVASLRTKTVQRSNALAALEGHPHLPPIPATTRLVHDRSSYLGIARGGPVKPPPRMCLPPLPSGLAVPATPPRALRTEEARRTFRKSESFLDFSDDDYNNIHSDAPPWSQGKRPPPDVPDEVAVLSTRFSSLPLRQLELPMRQVAVRNGSGSSSPVLQDLGLARSRSSPRLRSDAWSPALEPISDILSRDVSRKNSKDPYPQSSLLSLSSEDISDGEDVDEDWTNAFPRPPGT